MVNPKLYLGYVRSKRLKRTATRPEKAMIEALTHFQYWFKFQSYFYDDNVLFIPDFRLATDTKKLILEIDGPSHDRQREYDKRRTAWLETNRNCIVVRVTNEQALNDASGVIDMIAAYDPYRIWEKRCRLSKKELNERASEEEYSEFCDPADQFKFYA